MGRVHPHLDDHHRWILPEVLDEHARSHPDSAFLTVIGEGQLTYGEAADCAARTARMCAEQGVSPGDRVAVLLPNGVDFVRVWLGLTRLGAVMVPLNTALTGPFLAHQLRDSGVRHVVASEEFARNLDDICDSVPDFQRLRLDEWSSHAPWDGEFPEASDIACLMYTSGTTGPSKGVLMPHAHCYLYGRGSIEALGIDENDRYYICMPLFHANGLFMQLGAVLIAGASAVMRHRFSASRWLSDIRDHKCTVTNLLGSMSQFLIDRPETRDDARHSLRVICPVPNPPAHEEAWRRRFGVREVVSAYGMTEVNIPLYGRIGESRPGTAGKVLDRWFEVSIRDPHNDDALPVGSPGEIMVRPRVPFGFMAGYAGLPEATVEAWRNFWYHTGDTGVADEDGWVKFVDRTKDCIRRRGENISSAEVEAAIAGHAGVAEAAAYAVPAGSEGTEDEVMLAVVPNAGARITPEEVAAQADEILPRFARPRYIEIVSELPKTPTSKVRKQELRERAVTSNTWDREG